MSKSLLQTIAWVASLSLALIALLAVFIASTTGQAAAFPIPDDGEPALANQLQVAVTIPRDDETVTLDGACDAGLEYGKAIKFQFNEDSISGTVYLKHNATHLFLCMEGMSGTDARRFASVYLDADNGQEKWAEGDDYSLRVDIITGTESSWVGTGVSNGYTSTVLADWTAVVSHGDYDVAEYKIAITLTGGLCNAPFGMAVYHHWVEYTGNDYGWPSNQWFDQPQTWQTAQFAEAPCPSADLSLAKYDDPDPVTGGALLTYTLVVDNGAGPDTAIGIKLTDTLPAEVTYIPDRSDERCTEVEGTVTCNLGDLDQGWNTTVYIVVIPPSSGGVITNSAIVTAKSADGKPDNNTDTISTTVNPAPIWADLAVTKSDTPDPVVTGAPLTYTIVVNNNGPYNAPNVVVNDTLPLGVNALTYPAYCTLADQTMTCSLGELASKADATVTIVVSPKGSGAIVNTVTVGSDIPDSDTTNNTATASTIVQAMQADLLVTDLWPDDSFIAYQLLNASDTPAAAGHQTGLWVDGVKIGDQQESQALAGWERRVNRFAWTCSPPTDTIKVCANIAWQVPESDYQNNCRTETWNCDKTAPRFVAGPAAADVTATSASICWTTDEPVTGTVRYDQQGLVLGQSAAAPGLAAQHCVPLTKLAAGAAYHYVVEAVDATGNRVASRDLAFTTLPAADSQAPQVTLALDVQLAGRVMLRPAATDDQRVARVTFLVDDQPVGTDFSAPFAWEVDTTVLADGNHTFTAQAEDAAGNGASAVVSRQVLNHLPQELSPIQVNILAPVSGQEVGQPIRFELQVTHRFGLPIRQLVFMADDRVVGTRQYTCSATTPARPIARCTGDVPLRETWMYDGSGLPAGSTHRMRVIAFDYLDPSNRGEAAVQFTIAQPTELAASRQVVRDGAFFRVTLQLENHGLLATEAISITDASLGYQPVGEVWAAIGAELPTTPVTATLGGNNNGSSAELSYAYPGVLGPGQTLTIVYNVVPVLLEAPTAPHIIGSELRLSYRQAGTPHTQRWTDLAYRSSAEFAAALAASDYLVISRPAYRMALASAVRADEFALRGAVADLARARVGVLGYLDLATDDAAWVKSLLTSPGSWGAQLRPGWMREGYLLLVGEDEVPAYDWPTTISYWNDGAAAHHGDVDKSDNWYADTVGNDHRPELRVGRIVGQNTRELTQTIRNILNVIKGAPGHSFDRSDALALAGPDSTWDNHAVKILSVASVLRNSIPPSTVDVFLEEYIETAVDLRRNALAILGSQVYCDGSDRVPFPADIAGWRDGSNQALTCRWDMDDETSRPEPPTDRQTLLNLITEAQATRVEAWRRGLEGAYTIYDDGDNDVQDDRQEAGAAIIAGGAARLPGKDILAFFGHGWWGAWQQFAQGNFGSARAVMLAASCLTGRYFGIDGAAESAFRAGAVAYIGATEQSSVALNEDFVEQFYARFWRGGTTIGEALTRYKQALALSGLYGGGLWNNPGAFTSFFLDEYNLYGDPKYGAVSSGGAAATPATVHALPTPPPTTVQVTVPPYTVTVAGGLSQVRIPGGATLHEEGWPELPYHVERLTIPAGYQVRDVALVGRSAPLAVDGLAIIAFEPLTATASAASAAFPVVTGDEGWYPARDFDWTVWRNEDGSSELVLTLYAFQHNALTRQGRFYANYTFQISYTTTSVALLDLAAGQAIYGLGEPVRLELRLANTGAAQDVVVIAGVRREGAGDAEYGLPMRVLREFSGEASLALEWDTAGIPPGDYVAGVKLTDADGVAAATGTAGFQLGGTPSVSHIYLPLVLKQQ